jgi:hypothetical protein
LRLRLTFDNETASILNNPNPKKLATIIWHLSNKSETHDFGFLSDVRYTYRRISRYFEGYENLALPELEGNLNWTETLQWISTNFTGIPICLSVFEGGNESLPNPNVMLNVTDIKQAMLACNVRMIRIAEVISWYMNVNQTYPMDYIRGILDFCKNNNLTVVWSEWKISDNVRPFLQSSIAGYEGIITYMYQTNNQYDEPIIGFNYARQFEHWGGSIQSWYWGTRGYGSERDMPMYLLVQHAVVGRNMGAQMLEFEPYWYFFDNEGKPLIVTTVLSSII